LIILGVFEFLKLGNSQLKIPNSKNPTSLLLLRGLLEFFRAFFAAFAATADFLLACSSHNNFLLLIFR